MPKRRSTLGGVDLGSREAYVRCTVVAPLLAVITLGVGAEIAFSAWVYPYAVERAGMRVDEAAYLSSLYWTCFTVGRMCMAPLASCFSAGALLLPTLACNVAAVVLIALQPESRVCLWIGTAAAGVGSELGIPLTHRGAATSVRLLTGHLREGAAKEAASGEGNAVADPIDFAVTAADLDTTLVVYMGLGTLPSLAGKVRSHHAGPHTTAFAW